MITIATLYLSLTLPFHAIRQPAAICYRRREEYEHPKPTNERKLKGWM